MRYWNSKDRINRAIFAKRSLNVVIARPEITNALYPRGYGEKARFGRAGRREYMRMNSNIDGLPLPFPTEHCEMFHTIELVAKIEYQHSLRERGILV